jgi:hypothetical protein
LQQQQRSIPVDYDFIKEVCSWSGTEIRTTLDLRTWFYLNFKWQDKAMDPIWCGGQGMKKHNTHIFYDYNGDFEAWTMNNLDLLCIGKSYTDCKIPAKQFINDYYRCDRYLKEKTKVNSGWWTADDTNGEKMYFGQKLIFEANETINGLSVPIAVDSDYNRHYLESMPVFDKNQYHQWNQENNFIDDQIWTRLIGH